MNDPIKELSKYRLEKAKLELEATKVLMEEGLYDQALNRAYYSIFHSMRAVLALDMFDSKKHAGVIAEFNKRYVKNGEFNKKFGRMIKDAEMLRSESDYKDFFTATKEQAEQQVENAKEFLETVAKHLEARGVE